MISRDNDPLAELRRAEASLPDSEVPLIQRARERSREAVDIVTAAVAVDPTLSDADRCCRDIDLLAELLCHLRVLARQAEQHRLAADELEAELEALSARVVELARRIAAAALPDWDAPARIRERSERLLPSRETLEEIADRLRRAVQPALLSHPAPEAVRLAALADQIAPRQA